MHELVKWRCIFGCPDCNDTTAHYIACPLLLSLVHECFSTPFGPTVWHRLGIIDPSPQAMILLATCFAIYHTLKGEYKNLICEAFRCHRFSEVHLKARNIGSDSFHFYKRFFSTRFIANQTLPGSRQIGYQQGPPSLASRFSGLRSDPSLVEVAPGVFSAVDPPPVVQNSVDESMDGCRRQR